MINQESKTLREFSSRFTVKGGTLTVYFGYDTAANHSGFYIESALNAGIRGSSTEHLKRIRSLNIDLFNRIIDAVGTTVYGVQEDFEEKSRIEVEKYIDGDIQIEELDAFYRLESDDECPNCIALDEMVAEYEDASVKRKASLLQKFNNSQRDRLMALTRDLIRDIREATATGIEYKNTTVSIDFEGLLRKYHNPTYYKRDIDYVRKARVRLYRNVLKRKYKPFAD